MAGMSGDDMGSAIQAKIVAIPGINITSTDELSAFCKALGNAVVEYLTANAVATCSIPASAIATAGSPSAQVGPPAPVSITGGLS